MQFIKPQKLKQANNKSAKQKYKITFLFSFFHIEQHGKEQKLQTRSEHKRDKDGSWTGDSKTAEKQFIHDQI